VPSVLTASRLLRSLVTAIGVPRYVSGWELKKCLNTTVDPADGAECAHPLIIKDACSNRFASASRAVGSERERDNRFRELTEQDESQLSL
jgi:hypothetical protein